MVKSGCTYLDGAGDGKFFVIVFSDVSDALPIGCELGLDSQSATGICEPDLCRISDVNCAISLMALSACGS